MRIHKKKQKGVRNYEAYLLIGSKGQGKTTLIMDMIEIYLTNFIHNRVFVHDPSDAFTEIKYIVRTLEELEEILTSGKWTKGAIRFVNDDHSLTEKVHLLIATHLTYALVVLDEWSEYVSERPTGWQMKLITKHRNRKLEMIYVAHSIVEIPLKFSRNDRLGRIILFKTGEKKLTKKDIEARYACADKFYPAYQRVLKAPTTDTYGQYFEIIDV